MKTSISIFCALVLCMFNLAAARRGLENDLSGSKRVAGGTTAANNKYNFVVKITREGNGKYPFCHGTIISSRWILTSALCFNSKSPKEVLAGTKRTSGGIVKSKVEKLIIHENYDYKAVSPDLALMKLSKELELGTTDESLKAIELPGQCEAETVGDKCFFAGHGYTSETSLGTDLNEIDLTIVDDASCAKKMNPLWPVVKETMFCATGDGKRTACVLDNGAPLVCKKGDKLVVRGLFSWSHLKCDPSYYSVFTRVSRFVDWIKTTMNDNP